MRRLFVASAAAALVILAFSVSSQEPPADAPAAVAPRAPAAADPQVERGRYLVENVAMCGQCHTPRDPEGELLMERWLWGAPVPVQTPEGYADKWAYKAPRIAGLPQHTDEQLTKLLTTGINRDGKKTMPPMPPFRMSKEDAEAIAAYLRSL